MFCIDLLILQVKAVVLDPNNEFNVDRTLTKDDVQKLIKVHILCCFYTHCIEYIYKQLPQ